MEFAEQIRMFRVKVETRNEAIYLGCVTEAHRSFQEGSEITGAPGQPVGQYGPGYHPGMVGGALRASVQIYPEAPFVTQISSHLVYAPPIEDGVGQYGPLQLRSTIGGFHSRALTIANWDRIVDVVTERVVGDDA